MTTSELLLLTHDDRRLHLVPLHALRSVLLSAPGDHDPDRTTVECTALPSGQVVHVKRDEIDPHLLPDDEVSAALTRFAVTGLRPASAPGPAGDTRALPMFGNLTDPTWLSLSLGGQCDSACAFCYTEWIRHEPRLTHEQAVRALEEAAAIPTLGGVVLTGGEPTLRKDLPGLVRHASAKGFGSIGLQTNGHRISDPEYLDDLVESGVTHVLLSLHGARRETHDGIAGRANSFDLALRALTALAARASDERVVTEVNFVVCAQNAEEAGDFPDLVRRVAPRASVRYSFPIVEGAAYDNVETTLPSLTTFVDRVSAAVETAAGAVPVSVANVPPCMSSAVGLPPTYTVSSRRTMLGVSPFASSATLRGEVGAKLQACGGCPFTDDCDGLQLPYLRLFPQAPQHVAAARGRCSVFGGTRSPARDRGAEDTGTRVTCELLLHLAVSAEDRQPVATVLGYDAADPFAVHATFHIGGGETVEWVFPRDLLAEGLSRPTGTGDVRVYPSRSHGRDVVCVVLASPEGEALLEAPKGALGAFLDRTDALVRPGTEHRHFDLDTELSHILAEG
ncbi:SsgA family sporulation/cell division regulator [Streptomyces sp. SID3212]|nr:SsgA family sporulation/cell division regulator [Streptomyces sp. SID3212]